jgi:nicotinamide mononucleotide transporter
MMNYQEWIQGFAGASPLEWTATIAGFLCVYLVIKRSVWCFFFGLIQVSIYAWIFFNVKLYSDMILHVFYVGFQIYGWLIWSKSRDDEGQVMVNPGKTKEYLLCLLVVVISTYVLGSIMLYNTDASFPYADAFTTCASLVAQWLLSHKKLFNWAFWIVVDVVAIVIYWQKGLFPTSALYLCFLMMAIIGQYLWWKTLNQQKSLRAE